MANDEKLNVPHGGLDEYVKGLGLSVLLTILSFGIVMYGDLERTTALIVISFLAVLQIITQTVYFLHMKNTPDQTWTLVTYIFTIFQVLLLVIASAWIMAHVHFNMMVGN